MGPGVGKHALNNAREENDLVVRPGIPTISLKQQRKRFSTLRFSASNTVAFVAVSGRRFQSRQVVRHHEPRHLTDCSFQSRLVFEFKVVALPIIGEIGAHAHKLIHSLCLNSGLQQTQRHASHRDGWTVVSSRHNKQRSRISIPVPLGEAMHTNNARGLNLRVCTCVLISDANDLSLGLSAFVF